MVNIFGIDSRALHVWPLYAISEAYTWGARLDYTVVLASFPDPDADEGTAVAFEAATLLN